MVQKIKMKLGSAFIYFNVTKKVSFYLKKYNTQKINIPNMKISNKDDNTSDYIYLISSLIV